MAYRAECVKSLSVPEELVTQYKKWQFPDDEKTHAYINCVFKLMGLFEEVKGFNIEHLVLQLGQNKDANQIRIEVTKCAEKKPETDAKKWAYTGLKCFQAGNLELIQLSVKKPE